LFCRDFSLEISNRERRGVMSDLRVNFPKPCDEPWENMTPEAGHRACSRCDRVVHDLSRYDVAEIEALLRNQPGSCVRASIAPSGSIDIKADGHGSVRRIVATVGVSAGLLMSPPALARSPRADGAIVGIAENYVSQTTVTARDANGNAYSTKTRSHGRYRIKNVPPGTYSVEFSSDCSGKWTVDNVIVEHREVTVMGEPSDDQRCIIVGLLEVDGSEG
jgi:hypothetical protein